MIKNNQDDWPLMTRERAVDGLMLKGYRIQKKVEDQQDGKKPVDIRGSENVKRKRWKESHESSSKR